MSDGRFDIIIIGAGPNGLTAAGLLAQRGRRVLLLERRSVVGGLAAAHEFHPGCVAPGLLNDTAYLRRDVIEQLQLERFGLTLAPGTPPVFMPCPPDQPGPGLLLHHDADDADAELSALSAHDAQQYQAYRAFLERVGRGARRLVEELPPDLTPTDAASFIRLLRDGLALRRLGRKDLNELLRLVPMCVADWLGDFFETQLLRCALAGPAIEGTSMGPWSPGSAAGLLRWALLRSGMHVPAGSAAVVEALHTAATAHGAHVRTNADVAAITIGQGAVEGVELTDGQRIEARTVIAACDPKRALLQLVAPRDISPQLEHRIESWRSAGTTARLDVALDGPLRFDCRPDLQVHRARTGDSIDDMERAFDASKYGRCSAVPILDILVPDGGNVVSITAHFAPYQLRGGWTQQARAALQESIVGAVQRHAAGFADRIVASALMTPVDIEQRYGVTGGHLHHGEHALDQLLVRPCPECARYRTPIAGLFLASSATHPGGGLTCAPGALAAAAVSG
jgi:phytoene dehydrogenase-like protein